MNLNIYDRIRLHTAAIANLNSIEQMDQFIAGNIKNAEQARIIKNKAIHAYAEIMKQLCEKHIEHALMDNDAYSAQFSNFLS
jgi:hypothetical protein